jgi:methionyl-tRNA synthetase
MTPELAATAAPVITKGIIALLGLLMVRDMVWKAIGLWKAGTKKQLAWFICIFIFNTLGILPIIYLAFFQKKEKGKK